MSKIAWMGVNNAEFFNLHQLFAVVGASADRGKFGNKVLRCYQKRGYPCVPINGRAPEIEGLKTHATLTSLHASLVPPMTMKNVGISIITGPDITNGIIKEAYGLGARSFLLQPGTYDSTVDGTCRSLPGIEIIKSCALVDLDCHDDF
jgi:predicted CoA-binding protein